MPLVSSNGWLAVWQLAALVFLNIGAASAQQDQQALKLSAPPRLVAQLGAHTLQELAIHVEVALERAVVFEPPVSLADFMQRSRMNDFELVLDESHVAAWRIEDLNHDPLLRVSADTRSVVVSRLDHPEVFSAADLSGRVLCAPSILHGGLAQFMSIWIRPFATPQTQVAGLDDFDSGQCDAFILPLKTWRAREFNPDIRILSVTEPMPGLSLTAASRLDPALRQRIVTLLLSPEGRTIANRLFEEADGSLPVQALLSDYAGLKRLMPPEFE